MTAADEKPIKEKGTLTGYLRKLFKPMLDWLAKGLVRLRIGPDMLTVAGLLLSAAAAYMAATGAFMWAGVLILLGGPLDALDGAVARTIGRESRFGSMLDSTLDRYGEVLLFGGIAYHLADSGKPLYVLVAFAASAGSLMVSYTRARSEGLGVDNKVGLLTRLERLGVLTLALLTGYVEIGLWIIAVLANVTALQRLAFVYKATRHEHTGLK